MEGVRIRGTFEVLVVVAVVSLVFPLSSSSVPVYSLVRRQLVGSSGGDGRQAACLSSWIVNQNKTKCFRYVGSFMTWDESEAYCKSYHGHLAEALSLQDFSFAQNLCSRNFSGCWVGGRGINLAAGMNWSWSDNSSHFNTTMFPMVQFGSGCRNLSCYNGTVVDRCTLFASGLASLVAENCSKSHAFLCMADLENNCTREHCHNEYIVILAVVSGMIFISTLAVVVWLLANRRNKKRKRSRKQSNSAASALVPPPWKVFTREELRSITKSFSEGNRLAGDAKTGGTYSGTLHDCSKVVVKRLKRSGFQRKKEFYSEVGRAARLHHPSLVAVKGCCYDHGDRYIVYEFIVNGPLDRWLHHVPKGGRFLGWPVRMKIATTLAQGIAFVHDKAKLQVVHHDIRASNILLDEEFGAHLMGVGLSKFVPWEVMHERKVIAGVTYGYLAPEFVYRNELTTKSDVYSFGVLLLEIVSGRRPAQAVNSVGWQSIFEWATPLVQSHRYLELLDPLISTSSLDIPETGIIQKVIDLVYACTQHVPSMRPRMSHVVHQLQQLAPPFAPVVL